MSQGLVLDLLGFPLRVHQHEGKMRIAEESVDDFVTRLVADPSLTSEEAQRIAAVVRGGDDKEGKPMT